MKQIKLIVMLSLLLSSQIYAFEKMPEVFCTSSGAVCATVQPEKPFSSLGENKFLLTLSSSEAQPIDLVKVDLWMNMGGHGHGSSPLKIDAVQSNEYFISKAYFVMEGNWLIRIKFTQNSVLDTISIPVTIDN